MIRITCLLVYILIFPNVGFGQNVRSHELELAPVFSDHMVIQRNMPVTIYGHAKPGSAVQVAFHLDTNKVITDEGGNWKAVFPPAKAGGPYPISVETDDKNIILRDVLIGDVWLCSGQSNMDFSLREAQTGEDELQHGQFPQDIRLMKFKSTVPWGNISWDSTALEIVDRFEFLKGSWQVPNAESVGEFSAIAYYFGKKIITEVDVPIGLVQVAVGGSPTESWIDNNVLADDKRFTDMLKDWWGCDQIYDWCKERASVNLGKNRTSKQQHPFMPGYNFRAGIAGLTGFPICGVIWYQGESNVHNVPLHEQLFEKLVRSWRQHWGYAFPFYYVQLSGIDRPQWPAFRDSQRELALRIPNSGMAVSYDAGDSLNVHPVRKKEVGERLATLALRGTYGQNIASSGPDAKRAFLRNRQILIDFTQHDNLSTTNKRELTGFELLTSSGMRFAVKARIVGQSVYLNVPRNEKITKVLYAYEPFTRANLCNAAGMPAPTFTISVQ